MKIIITNHLHVTGAPESLFTAEVAQEKKDYTFIAATRKMVLDVLRK